MSTTRASAFKMGEQYLLEFKSGRREMSSRRRRRNAAAKMQLATSWGDAFEIRILLSRHATKRCRQRGKQDADLNPPFMFGRIVRGRGARILTIGTHRAAQFRVNRPGKSGGYNP